MDRSRLVSRLRQPLDRHEGGRIFARTGGSGPPLALLHGFPESSLMWAKIAPQLATRFTPGGDGPARLRLVVGAAQPERRGIFQARHGGPTS